MPTPLPAPPRITIVEDDRSLLGALVFALEAEGYEVAPYGQASSLLAAPPPTDCMVVDMKLPDLDGLSLIRRLRGVGVTAPAILITTGPDERCRRAAREASVAIVEKPLVDGALRNAIDAAVLRVRG